MSNTNKPCNPLLFRFHNWSQWHIMKAFYNDHGEVKILESRMCLKCGKTDIKVTVKG